MTVAGLLDTSVLIAPETGRSIDAGSLPDQAYVSVITAAELHRGVLAAHDVTARAPGRDPQRADFDVQDLGGPDVVRV